MRVLLIQISVYAVVAILGPLLTIWSLNTLFGLGIAYGVLEWLAMVWLSIVTFGGLGYKVNQLKDKGE